MSEDLNLIDFDAGFYAGVDEVGRGPLAGPVVAACAYLDLKSKKVDPLKIFEQLRELGVTDSKKISEKKRNKILTELKVELSPGEVHSLQVDSFSSISYSIAVISSTLIDEINILNASLMAMEKSFVSCHQLHAKSEGTLVIDGNKALKNDIDGVLQKTLVKGDSKSTLVGLASIIAKQYRDELMKDYGEKYPGYGLESHAGYPTVRHKEAIANLGVLPIHRKTFRGVSEHVE